jgi:hypothetical protein
VWHKFSIPGYVARVVNVPAIVDRQLDRDLSRVPYPIFARSPARACPHPVADGQKIYVAISDIGLGGVADPKSPQGFRLTLDPNKGGGLHALDLKTDRIVRSAKPAACAAGRTDCSPAQSAAVTALTGVVFSGFLDGHLRGYSTATGEVR